VIEKLPRVLMVEDDADFALLVRRAFQKAEVGASLEVAGDGEQAISSLSNIGADRPVLVLLDLKLPKLSGFDVLRWIRGNADLSGVPVIVFTSSGQDRDRVEVQRLGAEDYKIKPPGYSELVGLMKDLHERWLSIPRRT
jgi:DNA-binding response OmpR family regulator